MSKLKEWLSFDLDLDSRPFWTRILWVLIALNIFIPIFFVTAPIGLGPEGDALDYRLPLIQWALAHHSYPNFYWTYVDDYPALAEIVMAFFRQFAEWGPRIVSVAGYAFFVLGTLRVSKVFLKNNWALLATVLVASAHLLVIQDNLVMVDVCASAFTVWSALYLLKEWESPQASSWNLIKAGCFGGAALATRYTQVPALAVLGFFATLIAARGKSSFGALIKKVFAFGIPIILFIGPWLIRNSLLNHNPVFPLGVSVLGGVDLTSERYHEFLNYVNSYGLGTSFKEFLLLPYRFAFFKEIFDYSVGPLPLAFLPWVLVLVLSPSLRTKKNILPFLLCIGFTAVWFISSKQSRFLIHALPFGIIAGMLGMLAWCRQWELRRFQSVLFITFVLMGGVGTLKHGYKHKLEIPGAPIAIKQSDIPQWLNAHLDGGKVLLLERTSNLFAVQGDFVFAYPHAYSTSLFDYRNYRDAAPYYNDLYNEGVRFLYLKDPALLKQLPALSIGLPALTLVYSGNTGGAVYALRKI